MWMVVAMVAAGEAGPEGTDPWAELLEASRRTITVSRPIEPRSSQLRQREGEPRSFEEDRPGTTLTAIYADYKLDSIKPDTGRPRLDTPLDRVFVGVRLRGGAEELGQFFGLFIEELEVEDLNPGPKSVAYGLEFGANGSYCFDDAESSSGFFPVLDYQLRLSTRYSSGRGPIRHIWFAELDGQLGAGVGYRDLQVTLGIMGSAVYGDIELPQIRTNFFADRNAGGYLRFALISRQAPVRLELEALFGDIRGGMLSFGLRF